MAERGYRGGMLDRRTLRTLRVCLLLGVTGVVTASCSGGGTTTNYGPGGPSPLSLIDTCDQICGNVLASCASAAGAPYNACVSACGDLSLVPTSCLNPFASYLSCVAGATSVQVMCGPGSTDVIVSPPDCSVYQQETLDCNASPGLVAACLAVPGNDSCAGPAMPGPNPEFCVGAPQGCAPPSPNPLGIGIYCCP
jgi:hypothetical protein